MKAPQQDWSSKTGYSHERKDWIRVWEEQSPTQRAERRQGPAIILLLLSRENLSWAGGTYSGSHGLTC